MPKATEFLERVHVDMKISGKPDRHGLTRMLGFLDSKSLPDGTSASVIKAIREWMVSDLQNQPVQLIVLDNDPAFTSDEMIGSTTTAATFGQHHWWPPLLSLRYLPTLTIVVISDSRPSLP